MSGKLGYIELEHVKIRECYGCQQRITLLRDNDGAYRGFCPTCKDEFTILPAREHRFGSPIELPHGTLYPLKSE